MTIDEIKDKCTYCESIEEMNEVLKICYEFRKIANKEEMEILNGKNGIIPTLEWATGKRG